jgi:hypothetical protein
MKFPITRESLQAFDFTKEREELQEEENQKILTENLERLCKYFKQSMRENFKEKKFVWRQISSSILLSSILLPKFIHRLKEIFIGCDIIVDPLKTYLIIDWS